MASEPASVLASIHILVTACAPWWAWMLVRAGSRYAGPADGFDSGLRRPRCEDCGYVLTGLSAGSTCPECGSSVGNSLPENRQRSLFAAGRSAVGRLKAFPSTCAAALSGRQFYKHLRMQGEHEHARRFAIWSCMLAAMILVGGAACPVCVATCESGKSGRDCTHRVRLGQREPRVVATRRRNCLGRQPVRLATYSDSGNSRVLLVRVARAHHRIRGSVSARCGAAAGTSRLLANHLRVRPGKHRRDLAAGLVRTRPGGTASTVACRAADTLCQSIGSARTVPKSGYEPVLSRLLSRHPTRYAHTTAAASATRGRVIHTAHAPIATNSSVSSSSE